MHSHLRARARESTRRASLVPSLLTRRTPLSIAAARRVRRLGTRLAESLSLPDPASVLSVEKQPKRYDLLGAGASQRVEYVHTDFPLPVGSQCNENIPTINSGNRLKGANRSNPVVRRRGQMPSLALALSDSIDVLACAA